MIFSDQILDFFRVCAVTFSVTSTHRKKGSLEIAESLTVSLFSK